VAWGTEFKQENRNRLTDKQLQKSLCVICRLEQFIQLVAISQYSSYMPVGVA